MSNMHISLPARINKDQPVTARWANDLRESIYRLASRKPEQKGSMPGGGSAIPYHVTLITAPGETPTYEVTVGWGYVCERIPGAGDAIAYHEAANMWDTENPDQLAKFAITAGQAVYIRTEVDEDGKIGIAAGDAVSIVVDADEETSTHYIPKVDNETSSGVAGHYLYKLAVLKEPIYPATTPTLEKWLTGSHIDHYQELPAILTAAAGGTNIGVIPKEWSESEKAYKLRAIKGLCGINVTQQLTTIDIKPDGNTFKVRLWRPTLSINIFTYAVIVTQPASPEKEFWVLNGVWYTSLPSNWDTCGGSGVPTYDFSYLAPVGGGS
jgi:hypothetical protein